MVRNWSGTSGIGQENMKTSFLGYVKLSPISLLWDMELDKIWSNEGRAIKMTVPKI